MIVTKVEAVTKTRFKVELDGTFAFVLYKGELSCFHIRVDEELPEETYIQIKRDVVLKRAKLRALHLLTDMARTESGLREKLKQGMYPEDVIEDALVYVRSFGYLDDYRYAQNFIESKRSSKSKKEIYALLCGKGVSPDLIDQAFESMDTENSEEEAICRIIRKRRIDPSKATREELHKLYGYLARKGFQYEDIRHAIQKYDQNA